MHLEHLEVRNFRALDSATLPNLPANVVIAGPNGCGKSTIFDAIRLWKSAYGGYIENEFAALSIPTAMALNTRCSAI
ncbi:MAG: hypothetical protein DMD95_23165 [Candidatus Rokuibacteriota bacterium]|nr:MAG: hypothetical protein DMD95_23165 [Candidatus Rokubacteria bacterium]